jgi:integrase
MDWADIRLATGLWELGGSKTGKQTVILPTAAIEILQRRLDATGGTGKVFEPAPGRPNHIAEPRRSWEALLKRAQIVDLTLHDLRRSLGSWMAAAGASEIVIGKALGHKPGSKATPVYTRLNLDPVRAAVQMAVDAIRNTSKQREGKVENETEAQTND